VPLQRVRVAFLRLVQAKLSRSIALVMPVFNEADGIAEFLHEIDEAFDDVMVIVVDDHSTDPTPAILQNAVVHRVELRVVRNEYNRGHGPSTLRALRHGVESGADRIVALDGDGQAHADELCSLLAAFEAGDVDVIEGVRKGRNESSYRRATSWVTRVITRVRARAAVPDANTPFRVYDAGALTRLLDVVPETSMVPNLWITVVSRRLGMVVGSATITTRPRLGISAVGSTWGKSRVSLPSRRCVRVCIRAIAEWFTQWPRLRRVIAATKSAA